MEDQYAIGATWYTSWGYDQTNVEFFKVVRETPGSIVLRRIGAHVEDGRLYPSPETESIDFGLAGNSEEWGGHRERDNARGYSEKMCRKPRRSRSGYLPQGVTIDDVRTAWPYAGGGQYETSAAGGAGH